MANPIRPSRRASLIDDLGGDTNEGQRQDLERQQRADEAYYQRTGIRRPPLVEHSVLVPTDSYVPDVANDGDSYIENAPSEIISPITLENIGPSAARNSVVRERNNVAKKDKQKKDIEFQKSIEKSREQIGNSIEGLDL